MNIQNNFIPEAAGKEWVTFHQLFYFKGTF